MCFNIIFRKNGKFPETEVSRNENMRKLGIKCMGELDEEIFSKKKVSRSSSCTGSYSEACEGCGFFEYEFGGKSRNASDDGRQWPLCLRQHISIQVIAYLQEIKL